jgi:hypothetical protein
MENTPALAGQIFQLASFAVIASVVVLLWVVAMVAANEPEGSLQMIQRLHSDSHGHFLDVLIASEPSRQSSIARFFL